MLVLSRVVEALDRNVERFRHYEAGQRDWIEACRQALEEVARWPRTTLLERLREVPCPGALPTIEQNRYDRPIIPFEHRWENHEQARAWAMQVLRGRPTFAADGSHIPPQRIFSIPIALIQVGWYENRHLPGGSYEKDVLVEVLPPDLITRVEGLDEGLDDASPSSEVVISLRRYQLEAGRIVHYLGQHAGDPAGPVAFFDGSLVASFASRLPGLIQVEYAQAAVSMLVASQKAGVPLIGYVDTSYAHDLTDMIGHATGNQWAGQLNDAALLQPYMRWGDRSPAYICARDDGILMGYQDPTTGADFSRQVAFVYLKTTADNPPARVEFPLWVLKKGRLEDVLNVVRAEVIVGNGYPYALETADAVAALTLEDRERFCQVFQEFARRHNLTLRYSRKEFSKLQRRP